MKRLVLLLAVAGLMAWWWWPAPPAREMALGMDVDPAAGRIRLDGTTYRLNLSAESERHAGLARVWVRADHDPMPIITHEVVLTTGEYSDPDKVEIGPLRDGSTWWRARRRPQGTLIVLHLIPADVQVAAILDRVREGQTWTFTGYGVVDQRIERDDGYRVSLGHDNHRFLLVTEAAPGTGKGDREE